ncbi:MAG: DUF4296 domain-containing protein [Bacteroidota bacterium]
MKGYSSLWILGILVLLGLLSCAEEAQPQLISMEGMKDILIDIHLADAMADQNGGPLLHRKIKREDLYANIFEKYGVEKETFWQTYEYYLKHPVGLDSIYTHVLKDLENMEMDIDVPERMKKRHAQPDAKPKDLTKKKLPEKKS